VLNEHFTLSVKFVLIIIVSGFLGVSSFDLTQIDITVQTLQEKCTPGMGTNISKSDCLSHSHKSSIECSKYRQCEAALLNTPL
jgi:hypothetical protein